MIFPRIIRWKVTRKIHGKSAFNRNPTVTREYIYPRHEKSRLRYGGGISSFFLSINHGLPTIRGGFTFGTAQPSPFKHPLPGGFSRSAFAKQRLCRRFHRHDFQVRRRRPVHRIMPHHFSHFFTSRLPRLLKCLQNCEEGPGTASERVSCVYTPDVIKAAVGHSGAFCAYSK